MSRLLHSDVSSLPAQLNPTSPPPCLLVLSTAIGRCSVAASKETTWSPASLDGWLTVDTLGLALPPGLHMASYGERAYMGFVLGERLSEGQVERDTSGWSDIVTLRACSRSFAQRLFKPSLGRIRHPCQPEERIAGGWLQTAAWTAATTSTRSTWCTVGGSTTWGS